MNSPASPALILTALLLTFLSSCRLPDKPVSKQEALDLAKKIERSVNQQNEAVLNNIFDEKRFTQRVVDEAHQRFNLSFATEVKSAISELHWGHQVVTSTTGGGTYSLVHQYEKDGHQHLLFRLFESSTALNYHDFELTKTDEGIKAVDVYNFSGGEEFSKTLAQSLVLLSDKISDMNADEKSRVLHVRKINELLEGGNAEQARRNFDELPGYLRKDKAFQLMHIRITSKLGDSAYLSALNEYKTDFPKDPNLGLLLIDAYVMQKDYPAAISAVDHLDSAVHRDTFLDYDRALICKLEGDPAQSRYYLRRLYSGMPLFGKGAVELIDNYVNAGYPDSAAMVIRQEQAASNITASQLTNLESAYPQIKRYLK